MKLKIIAVMLVSLIMLCGCNGNSYITDSKEKPIISTNELVFNCTVDECIDILNKELSNANMSLISAKYEIVKHNYGIAYVSKITDNIKVRFVTYKTCGSGIVRIGISSLNSYEFSKDKKMYSYNASEKDIELAEKYYNIICKSVCPSFNVKKFINSDECNTIDLNLNLGGLVFSQNDVFYSTVNSNEDTTIYDVFSSKKIYKKYEEKLYDDVEQYIHSSVI